MPWLLAVNESIALLIVRSSCLALPTRAVRSAAVYWGTPIEARIARIDATMVSSSSVKPPCSVP